MLVFLGEHQLLIFNFLKNLKKGKTFIIAEAGINHNGSLSKALKLVDAAKKSGADAIKFQIWKTEMVVTKDIYKANYQKKIKINFFNFLKKHEFPLNYWSTIRNYCKKKKIEFMATADEINSAYFINKFIKFIKIGSAENNDIPFLKKIAKLNKTTLISTGLSNLKDVKIAYKTLLENGLKKKKIFVLHCNSAYPTPLEDINLRVLNTFIAQFGKNVGLSDHTTDLDVPSNAVALGARVIEKHLTINKRSPGPDHSISLNPKEFFLMVEKIRKTEISLGKEEKNITKSENVNYKLIRKSIYALNSIKKNEIYNYNNLVIKRPYKKTFPKDLFKILGKKSNRNYKPDDPIKV